MRRGRNSNRSTKKAKGVPDKESNRETSVHGPGTEDSGVDKSGVTSSIFERDGGDEVKPVDVHRRPGVGANSDGPAHCEFGGHLGNGGSSAVECLDRSGEVEPCVVGVPAGEMMELQGKGSGYRAGEHTEQIIHYKKRLRSRHGGQMMALSTHESSTDRQKPKHQGGDVSESLSRVGFRNKREQDKTVEDSETSPKFEGSQKTNTSGEENKFHTKQDAASTKFAVGSKNENKPGDIVSSGSTVCGDQNMPLQLTTSDRRSCTGGPFKSRARKASTPRRISDRCSNSLGRGMHFVSGDTDLANNYSNASSDTTGAYCNNLKTQMVSGLVEDTKDMIIFDNETDAIENHHAHSYLDKEIKSDMEEVDGTAKQNRISSTQLEKSKYHKNIPHVASMNHDIKPKLKTIGSKSAATNEPEHFIKKEEDFAQDLSIPKIKSEDISASQTPPRVESRQDNDESCDLQRDYVQGRGDSYIKDMKNNKVIDIASSDNREKVNEIKDESYQGYDIEHWCDLGPSTQQFDSVGESDDDDKDIIDVEDHHPSENRDADVTRSRDTDLTSSQNIAQSNGQSTSAFSATFRNPITELEGPKPMFHPTLATPYQPPHFGPRAHPNMQTSSNRTSILRQPFYPEYVSGVMKTLPQHNHPVYPTQLSMARSTTKSLLTPGLTGTTNPRFISGATITGGQGPEFYTRDRHLLYPGGFLSQQQENLRRYSHPGMFLNQQHIAAHSPTPELLRANHNSVIRLAKRGLSFSGTEPLPLTNDDRPFVDGPRATVYDRNQRSTPSTTLTIKQPNDDRQRNPNKKMRYAARTNDDFIDPTSVRFDHDDDDDESSDDEMTRLKIAMEESSDEDWRPEKGKVEYSKLQRHDELHKIPRRRGKKEQIPLGLGKVDDKKMKKRETGNTTNKSLRNCPTCGKLCNGEYQLRRHLLSHSDQRPHQCPHCGKGFKQKAHLQGHVKNLSCKVGKALKKSSSSGSINKKVLKTLPSRGETAEQNLPEPTKSAEDSTEIKREYRIIVPPKKRVPRAGRPKKIATVRHYACQLCGKSFKTAYRLKRHEQSHTNERPYACRQCGKRFKQSGHRNEHEANHEKKNVRFLCNRCGVVFRCRSSFNNHMRAHALEEMRSQEIEETSQTNDSNRSSENGMTATEAMMSNVNYDIVGTAYDCPYCVEKFATAQGLNNHLESHVEITQRRHVQPYKCDVCRRTFTYRHNLVKHSIKHKAPEKFAELRKEKIEAHVASGKPSYKCPHCSKIFIRKETLAKHAKTHTGARPFKCTVCSQGFRQNIHLKVHMRKHTGSRPFQCRECGKGFIDSTALAKHIEYEACNSENVLFRCTICHKRHYYLGSIKQHIRREHNITDDDKLDALIARSDRSLGHRANKKQTKKTTATTKKSKSNDSLLVPNRCIICTAEFEDKHSLLEHVKERHAQIVRVLSSEAGAVLEAETRVTRSVYQSNVSCSNKNVGQLTLDDTGNNGADKVKTPENEPSAQTPGTRYETMPTVSLGDDFNSLGLCNSADSPRAGTTGRAAARDKTDIPFNCGFLEGFSSLDLGGDSLYANDLPFNKESDELGENETISGCDPQDVEVAKRVSSPCENFLYKIGLTISSKSRRSATTPSSPAPPRRLSELSDDVFVDSEAQIGAKLKELIQTSEEHETLPVNGKQPTLATPRGKMSVFELGSKRQSDSAFSGGSFVVDLNDFDISETYSSKDTEPEHHGSSTQEQAASASGMTSPRTIVTLDNYPNALVSGALDLTHLPPQGQGHSISFTHKTPSSDSTKDHFLDFPENPNSVNGPVIDLSTPLDLSQTHLRSRTSENNGDHRIHVSQTSEKQPQPSFLKVSQTSHMCGQTSNQRATNVHSLLPSAQRSTTFSDATITHNAKTIVTNDTDTQSNGGGTNIPVVRSAQGHITPAREDTKGGAQIDNQTSALRSRLVEFGSLVGRESSDMKLHQMPIDQVFIEMKEWLHKLENAQPSTSEANVCHASPTNGTIVAHTSSASTQALNKSSHKVTENRSKTNHFIPLSNAATERKEQVVKHNEWRAEIRPEDNADHNRPKLPSIPTVVGYVVNLNDTPSNKNNSVLPISRDGRNHVDRTNSLFSSHHNTSLTASTMLINASKFTEHGVLTTPLSTSYKNPTAPRIVSGATPSGGLMVRHSTPVVFTNSPAKSITVKHNNGSAFRPVASSKPLVASDKSIIVNIGPGPHSAQKVEALKPTNNNVFYLSSRKAPNRCVKTDPKCSTSFATQSSNKELLLTDTNGVQKQVLTDEPRPLVLDANKHVTMTMTPAPRCSTPSPISQFPAILGLTGLPLQASGLYEANRENSQDACETTAAVGTNSQNYFDPVSNAASLFGGFNIEDIVNIGSSVVQNETAKQTVLKSNMNNAAKFSSSTHNNNINYHSNGGSDTLSFTTPTTPNNINMNTNTSNYNHINENNRFSTSPEQSLTFTPRQGRLRSPRFAGRVIASTLGSIPATSSTPQVEPDSTVKPTNGFACDECGKTFNARHRLKRHETTHTNFRPYVCGQCGRAFRQKVHLSDHMKRHAGDRPFVCNGCGRRFVLKNEMNQHIKHYCFGSRPLAEQRNSVEPIVIHNSDASTDPSSYRPGDVLSNGAYTVRVVTTNPV